MPRPVREQVVVLTGASSGIGRATALRFARAGSRLVLAARSADPLGTLAAEVTRLGGTAEVVPADVSDWTQVQELARTAAERFGRIDTWVNDAAVTLYATVEDSDVADIRRVVEVDLLGSIHGMKAALPYLRANGQGVIVNVSSALGVRAVPLQAAYCAAKHGIIGFAEALRLELRHEGVPIDVVDVLPSGINTPLFRHARSALDRMPKPLPPLYEPDVVAQVVVRVAAHPVRTVYVGSPARMIDLLQRISPALTDRVLLGPARVWQQQFSDRPPTSADNLHAPTGAAGEVTGPYGGLSKSTSIYTTLLGLHPARARALGAVALAGTVALARRSALRR